MGVNPAAPTIRSSTCLFDGSGSDELREWHRDINWQKREFAGGIRSLGNREHALQLIVIAGEALPTLSYIIACIDIMPSYEREVRLAIDVAGLVDGAHRGG